MAIHKLHIDEFDEIDYQLIAIHTSLEDYRLAFFINQKLPVLLERCSDIQIIAKNGKSCLSRYRFSDEDRCMNWNLLQNKSEVYSQTTTAPVDLFGEANVRVSSKAYLLPEFKKVDYFLQVEQDEPASEITGALQEIQQVTLSYLVENDRIKSKNNLIF